MESKMKYDDIVDVIRSNPGLTMDELYALNKVVVSKIKILDNLRKATAATKFAIGDVVVFNAKTRGMKRITITGFNRAGTAVVGEEVYDNNQLKSATPKWKVSTTLLTKVA